MRVSVRLRSVVYSYIRVYVFTHAPLGVDLQTCNTQCAVAIKVLALWVDQSSQCEWRPPEEELAAVPHLGTRAQEQLEKHCLDCLGTVVVDYEAVGHQLQRGVDHGLREHAEEGAPQMTGAIEPSETCGPMASNTRKLAIESVLRQGQQAV